MHPEIISTMSSLRGQQQRNNRNRSPHREEANETRKSPSSSMLTAPPPRRIQNERMYNRQNGNCEDPGSSLHHQWLGRTTMTNTVDPDAYVSLSDDDSEVRKVCVNVRRAKTLSKSKSAKNVEKVDYTAVNNQENGVFLVKCGNGKCKQRFESLEAMTHHLLSYHAKGRKNSFCCHLCQKNYLHAHMLRLHMRVIHTGQRDFKCTFRMCSKSFTSKGILSEHINAVHTKENVYKCTKCPKKFYRKRVLKRHLSFQHGEGIQYFCYLCKKKSVTKHHLRIHMNSVHTRHIRFQCPFRSCATLFTLKSTLTKHINAVHTKANTFKCTKCPKKFYRKDQLIKHLAYAHGVGKTQRCNLCQRTLSSKHNLQGHMNSMHPAQSLFKCPVATCREAYETFNDLKQHTWNAHSEKRLYQCEECPRVFSARSSLTQHLTNVHGKGHRMSFVCDICQKSLSTKRSLQRHRSMHTDQSLFKCSDCSNVFTSRALLERHLNGAHIICGRGNRNVT